jgi:dynactin complex subunit
VWIGGSKSGTIAFIGLTKFAAGEWVGVDLDEPGGKNDGSVGNVSYFKVRNLKALPLT